MLIETLVLDLFIGLFIGGKLNRLSRLRIRAVPLVIAALAMQAAVYWLAAKHIAFGPVFVYSVVHILSYIILLWFIYYNRRLPGIPFAALGIALNGAVIALNHGQMPVDPTYLPEATRLALLAPGTHGLLAGSTKLGFLADRFFISIPYLGRQIFSWGDVLIDMGVSVLILATMKNEDNGFSFLSGN